MKFLELLSNWTWFFNFGYFMSYSLFYFEESHIDKSKTTCTFRLQNSTLKMIFIKIKNKKGKKEDEEEEKWHLFSIKKLAF